MKGEPRDELVAEAALGEGEAVVGEEGGAAEGAVEVVAVEPPVDAAAVEDVAAGEHADLLPVLEGALAEDAAVVGAAAALVAELVGEGELIGEHDEAGEARSDCGQEGLVHDLVAVESAQPQRLQQRQKHGAEVVDARRYLRQHQHRNRP